MASNAPTRSHWRLLTLFVALALVTVPLGSVAAQQSDSQSFVAVQDGQCTPITSFTGNESVREFYDYRVEDPDNPYSNTTGNSYSSEGTIDLQQANTSLVFLYTDTTAADDTRSLVFVHGNEGNADSAGGAITFDITGLPEDGRWAVKDDEYDDPTSYDNWSADVGDTVVDWTWAAGATDGGAYAGLGDDAAVAIDPAFNEEAALFEAYYNGTVDQWQLLSNESDGVSRTQLDQSSTLYVLAGSCDDVETDGGIDVDGDDRTDGADGNGDVTQTETETTTQTETETATETTTTQTDTETATETPVQTETETATETTTQTEAETATETTTQTEAETATETTTQTEAEGGDTPTDGGDADTPSPDETTPAGDEGATP